MNDFWKRVQKTEACWYYLGGKSGGYGYVYAKRGTHLAHRIAYELAVGPIPSGCDVDHLCFVKSCVRPSHLEAVSRGENTRRSNIHHRILRTQCRRGHPRNKLNARLRRDGKGTVCRLCHREYMRAWQTPQPVTQPAEGR